MISVIIVTFNSAKYIVDCLNSVYKFSFSSPIEIIVVDNNSCDNTTQKLNQFYNKIKIIGNKKNLGFARACNKGIKKAHGKYIMLLNPDTRLENDVVNIFYAFMETQSNHEVWCVGAQLFDENINETKSAGRFPTIIDAVFEQMGIKLLLRKFIPKYFIYKNNVYPNNTFVPYVLGCNMFIRRSVLELIGLFNESFFLNYEEAELSWRASKAGYKCMILPQAKIIHYSQKSFKDLTSYLDHLYCGQLQFFQLTSSRFIFQTVKLLHMIGASLRLLLKLDKKYLIRIRDIISIRWTNDFSNNNNL